MKTAHTNVFAKNRKLHENEDTESTAVNLTNRRFNLDDDFSYVLNEKNINVYDKAKLYSQVASCITRCTRGDARIFFCTRKTSDAQNEICYEYI